PNFFTDNENMVWHFRNMDLSDIVHLREPGFQEAAQYPYAPSSVEDALDNYYRVMELLGGICGDFIAPRATDVDRHGCTLENGKVSYAPGTVENLKALSQADLMGFTLPRKYGGLNMPHTLYCMANDMVSRADASLMNLFGLQDIAETIRAFGSEEQRQRYLPKFCSGEVTGAMVLTEPDAGSDLQSIRTRAHVSQDADGQWRINGVKRFITNGCGEVLLVMARSEEGTTDARGISLFIVEKGPDVVIQRIEDKLGIHGSPTCQIFFNNAKADLVGQRRRGLITYVMALMNGARIGIAAQGVGVAEAAYRAALAYAVSRRQFGKAIFDISPVSELLVDMKVGVETGRSLLYECGRAVDREEGLGHKLETMDRKDPAYAVTKEKLAFWRKVAAVLTPLAKFYCCEMALDVTSKNIQVHGGSGFMRDYEAERYWRDARITTIYEGTTELQGVAIQPGVMGGNIKEYLAQKAAKTYTGEPAQLHAAVRGIHADLDAAVAHLQQRGDNEYTALMAKRLSSITANTVIGYLMVDEASRSERRLLTARHFIRQAAVRSKALLEEIRLNNDTAIRDYRAMLEKDVPRE
ncbi:MAG TPA: acyl-CoA dehydrogenase family protein, partial [Candidatus Brocadiia bacterium]|nr:acyl-CoA dehydrogenase family protein [Candidatus Brocadiia bacterium]